jgi:hypothetical protein
VSNAGGEKAPSIPTSHFCHACFSGKYAIPFSPTTRRQMRLVGV